MRSLRAGWRLSRALVQAFAGLMTIVFVFPRVSQPERHAHVQAWARRLLEVMGIELQVHGQPPQAGPMLIVANHISWLDIPLMHAAGYCRFVSKDDVKHWPLIGKLATGAGTLYIERESRRDALRVVHHMADSLRSGDVLAVFPEGTTNDGAALLPFHANLLQAAIAAQASVLPVALSYLDAATGQQSAAPRYIAQDTLLGSVWRTLMASRVQAVVCFGVAEQAQGRDRRAWAADLRKSVDGLRRR